MGRHDNRWMARLLAASCLGTALLGTPGTGAADSGRIQVAMAGPTEEDLLMFWEEKELYVQTATRSEKPLTQVAENMTVITAREIEAMNANSLSEVLARVPGLFVEMGSNDFNPSGQLHIQGSDVHHVTLLLDGMPFNFPSGGNADISFIPVRIVERIEIIKGAASSAWGSALGGVVNIITRGTGDSATPNGSLGGSWGKQSSRNIDADLRGKNGPLAYYLYAGQQGSDGLVNNRDFQRSSVFGKFMLTPNRDLDITVSAGFSNPEQNSGDTPAFGINSGTALRQKFINGALEYRATPELTLHAGAYLFKGRSDIQTHFLADGSLFKQNIFDEQNYGGNLRATWSSGFQTLTAGAEASRASMDETTNTGPLYQSYGLPATLTVSPGVSRTGVFVNDTVELGPFAVTPGIRFDHDSISGNFYSPSLGLTWELAEHTVARASASRGFTSPPLAYSKGGGLFFVGNPKLTAEYGWTYQVGLESAIANLANVKATIFRHDISKALSLEIDPAKGAPYKHYVNREDVTRQGYELEAESVAFYNLSLKLGHAYAHNKWDTVQNGYATPSYDTYSWLVGIKYDDRRSVTALLSGSYVYWDLAKTMPAYPDPAYTTFIWDITGTKKFRLDDWNSLEAFATVHNIFSGDHYTSSISPNAGRWFEAGVRLKF